MKKLGPYITNAKRPFKDRVKVKSRFDDADYWIDLHTYYYIKELTDFYHESIYLFPDNEKVSAIKYDDSTHLHDSCQLKLNELVF